MDMQAGDRARSYDLAVAMRGPPYNCAPTPRYARQPLSDGVLSASRRTGCSVPPTPGSSIRARASEEPPCPNLSC